MLNDLQKRTAQAIVNIFETGHVQGDYGKVTLLRGDTGHLTYGRSQTTLGSGNLYLLIKSYCEEPGAEFGPELNPFLDKLEERDATLDHDATLRSILNNAGDDPVMQEVQDRFFDRVYWAPCIRAASGLGIGAALGTTVVYDSHIHGSWRRMRNRTNDAHGLPSQIGEQTWVQHYVEERKTWLANHSNALLHRTVYRMDTFQLVIDSGKWNLSLPLRIRGVDISQEILLEGPPVRVSAHDDDERILKLRSPIMQGDDVREVQQALKDAGLTVDVDGIFGSNTGTAIRQFQNNKGLTPDGIVGPATRSALGL